MIDLKAKFVTVSLLLSLCFIRTRPTNSWTWYEQGIGKILAKQCFAVIVLLLNQVPFCSLNASYRLAFHLHRSRSATLGEQMHDGSMTRYCTYCLVVTFGV